MVTRDEARTRDDDREMAVIADVAKANELEEKREMETLYSNAQAATILPIVTFGWIEHLDTTTNTMWYVHSYTGEVRGPVVQSNTTDSRAFTGSHHLHGDVRSQCCSHLVMLPTGIMPVHPQSSQLDSWRGGYTRYPMHQTSNVILQESHVSQEQAHVIMQLGHRVLPCTWERSPHGSPFLGPFPVAILQPVDFPATPAQSNCTEVSWSNTSYCYPAHMPNSSNCGRYPQLAPVVLSHNSTKMDPPATTPRQFKVQNNDKAHNRRGYNLRQTRKLMKQLGLLPTKPTQVSSPDCLENTTTSSPQSLVNDLRELTLSPPTIPVN